MSDEEFDFEEQIRLEEEERKKAAGAKTKVDEDGTEYEWDDAKQAWFPKIDANFIAQYQMNYGNFEGCKDPNDSAENKSDANASQNIPPAPPVDHPAYYYWYYHIYLPSQQKSQGEDTKAEATDSEDKSLKSESKDSGETDSVTEEKSDMAVETTESKDSQEKETTENKDSQEKESGEDAEKSEKDTSDDKSTPDESESYEEYYKKYYDYYYGQQGANDGSSNLSDWSSYYEYYKQYYDQGYQENENSNHEVENSGEADGDNADKSKKAKKRKQAQKDQGWFEMDQSRNTSVYVSNLPFDITDEEYKELMTKCGLIAMDPAKHQLKLKLYRDKDGEVKGDGLCSYIKMESVDLALNILDGYRLRDHEISVELAKFEMKGSYDPSKKKKKLTNKEKRKLKERQEKLFDWKLDKGRGVRNNCEKTLVFKNIFDPAEFNTNPASIFQLRDKLKLECSKYGEVRKVVVYDRHPEKVATAAFAEVEEADVCRQQMDNRFFNQRTIRVDAWDGKTKYTVKESEEEEKKRLDEWEKYLQEDEAKSKAEAEKSKTKSVEQSSSAAANDQPVSSGEASTQHPKETSQQSPSDSSESEKQQPETEAMDTSEKQMPDSTTEKG